MVRTLKPDRQTTIKALYAALATAVAGTSPSAPTTLVLTAGPGTGKSHTLALLRSELPVRSRYACADDLSWRQPFMLAAALVGVDLPSTIPDGFADVLYAEVDALCSDGPLLLLIDDAHHADASSLELLLQLSAAARDLPLVLVVGRRPLPERELLSRLIARPQVAQWSLPPMRDKEIAQLCRDLLGADPDDSLVAALAPAGGNPLHAISLLRTLEQSGGLRVSGGRVGVSDDASVRQPEDDHDAVAEHLALLDPQGRDLTQRLAVWGTPATLADLAAIDDTRPASLVAAAQSAVDAGILVAADDGTLAFTHDLYAEVTYEHLAPAFRSVLHDAIADLPQTTASPHREAHHRLASGTDEQATRTAVQRARSELENAPAVTVDLLDTLAERPAATTTGSAGVHLPLAVALARTGQFNRAADAAAEGLIHTADLDEFASLRAVQLFSHTARGDTASARDLIDDTLALPVDDDVAQRLQALRWHVDLLEGSAPVPDQPFFSADTDLSTLPAPALTSEGLRLFLTGRLNDGLKLTLRASAQQPSDQTNRTLGTSSADIWPPLIELFARGPAAAADLLAGITHVRTARGTDWMAAYHEFTNAGIELGLGRLDNAAATWDAGLDLAASADMGWTSIADGGRALVDVLRGDLAAASSRLEAWAGNALPDQFGIDIHARVANLLLEARRKLRPAAAGMGAVFTRAVSRRLYAQLPTLAVDCARLGVRAQDLALLEMVADTLEDLGEPSTSYAGAHTSLALARCAASLGRIDLHALIAVGLESAEVFRASGDQVLRSWALEEIACATATLGDRDKGREYGRSALALTQGMGAVTVSTRIASRLRPMGLRLDPSKIRERPTHGWKALTPTERTVAELVATGASGPDIASQLVISTRTVQTHVSHALTKLGLRTRVELAAYVTTNQQE
ncbi:helix-turn-helix transcriptional regulator [Gordonia polyisoprenivorans]|uniref:helix-turn-helix transcriptional regulator n=1 Tax=Gordonia polyisoprenivorans TaxID=84595 RepID=UPI001AD70A2A|nr:LuxR C-terminal-related transcriptional regulator [Gordonia polyisoprenivorans]QTI69604.1 helix-turn-helix transcriptional regulator [Gordonia polyisoprenivorans]